MREDTPIHTHTPLYSHTHIEFRPGTSADASILLFFVRHCLSALSLFYKETKINPSLFRNNLEEQLGSVIL